VKHRSEDPAVNAKALACPWCGSLKLKVLFTDEEKHRSTWVYCSGCQASGPTADGEIDAVHKWNNRRPPPPLPLHEKTPYVVKCLLLCALLSLLTGCASEAPTAGKEPERVFISIGNDTDQPVHAFLHTGSPFFPLALTLKPQESKEFWVWREYVPGRIRLTIMKPKLERGEGK
jgi:Lar family restriction alleviation protein